MKITDRIPGLQRGQKGPETTTPPRLLSEYAPLRKPLYPTELSRATFLNASRLDSDGQQILAEQAARSNGTAHIMMHSYWIENFAGYTPDEMEAFATKRDTQVAGAMVANHPVIFIEPQIFEAHWDNDELPEWMLHLKRGYVLGVSGDYHYEYGTMPWLSRKPGMTEIVFGTEDTHYRWERDSRDKLGELLRNAGVKTIVLSGPGHSEESRLPGYPNEAKHLEEIVEDCEKHGVSGELVDILKSGKFLTGAMGEMAMLLLRNGIQVEFGATLPVKEITLASRA